MEWSNDFLMTIWGVLPQVIGFALLVLILKNGMYWTNQGLPHHPSAGYEHKNISCDSPNCVRCRKYTALSKNALEKIWKEYIQTLSSSEYEQVSRVSFAIGSSSNAEAPDLRPTFELVGLGTTPYYEGDGLESDVQLLKTSYREIMKEYGRLSHKNQNWKINSTPVGEWRAFYLVNQGQTIAENVAACPVTYGVLQHLQNFMNGCMFGNACFSLIYPRTQITAHYGPCNLRLRCHLGLDIPEGCELIVDGLKKTWECGECLLFDDSFLHSVAHLGSPESSRPRVVLLVDLWNPGVTKHERKALTYLLNGEEQISFN